MRGGQNPRHPPALLATPSCARRSTSRHGDGQPLGPGRRPAAGLDRLTKTAAETRAAALAGQKATDWERNARVVTQQVDRAMDAALGRLAQADRHTERPAAGGQDRPVLQR